MEMVHSQVRSSFRPAVLVTRVSLAQRCLSVAGAWHFLATKSTLS